MLNAEDEREQSWFVFTSDSLVVPAADPPEVERSEEESICWQAPSVAALGWIPLFTTSDGLPAYFRETWHERVALRMLLESGNPPPPESFGSVAGFASYVDSKEFRSAIAIDEPKLYCNTDGTPRLFTFWRGHRVGFTPVPGALGRKLFDPLPGVCDESYTVTFNRDQATLNYWMGFKLGKLADWAGFAMIGHRAPSAMIHVQLTIRNTGEAFVTFHSSFVPSQHFYVGWQLVDRFNMLEDSDEEFRGFIEAGKCKNAPMARRVHLDLSCARNRRWLR